MALWLVCQHIVPVSSISVSSVLCHPIPSASIQCFSASSTLSFQIKSKNKKYILNNYVNLCFCTLIMELNGAIFFTVDDLSIHVCYCHTKKNKDATFHFLENCPSLTNVNIGICIYWQSYGFIVEFISHCSLLSAKMCLASSSHSQHFLHQICCERCNRQIEYVFAKPHKRDKNSTLTLFNLRLQ